MGLQLSTVELISAMYPEQLNLSDTAAETLDILQAWKSDDDSPPASLPIYMSMTISLNVEDDDSHQLDLHISIPLQSPDPEANDPPAITYSIRQPAWLSKAELAQLASAMPQDDIFSAFDYIRDEAPRFIRKSVKGEGLPHEDASPIVRVWFYFPSLSTRAKRDDLVNHAPGYSLTGFVLAGKPGVLCLEGTSANIDSYMKFIKTESWGDIPSHQKKVSERFRELNNVQRCFAGMEEITDAPFMGEKSGQRGNRTDMQTLELWLNQKGLGQAFEKAQSDCCLLKTVPWNLVPNPRSGGHFKVLLHQPVMKRRKDQINIAASLALSLLQLHQSKEMQERKTSSPVVLSALL
ncbi:hypothetical protein FH972_024884 [Carpinus fangiana]|uniref:Small nuclear ribonucleoprotein Prp3 C-terminal domain-containing protein n=1 Tax=Carpinus fangiana TaxID=176857 RepID=A0A5N6L001_9ROSI|nr:hypothetical protein FH972_024884 [Carpinus fangiana]